MKDIEKWAVALVECNCCKHHWTAVYPDDLEELECPNCSNMTIFNVVHTIKNE